MLRCACAHLRRSRHRTFATDVCHGYGDCGFHVSPLGSLLDTTAAKLVEGYPIQLAALPVFANGSGAAASEWSPERRRRFVGGLYHAYFQDGLLPALLEKLGSRDPALVGAHNGKDAELLCAALLRNEVAPGAMELPVFAKPHLKIPRKILGAGHRGKAVIRAEQLAACVAASRLSLVEVEALSPIFRALGASEALCAGLRLPSMYSGAVEEALSDGSSVGVPEAVSGELTSGVPEAVESGMNYVHSRQLLLWKQIGNYVSAAE